jgi:AcrR family transcriptional regulator
MKKPNSDEPKVRAYRSTARQAQAEETRRRIVAMALELLTEKGFDGVTMEEIANRAGVASPTVYAAFGSKRGIVRALIEQQSFGPSYAQIVSQVHAAQDPPTRLRTAAGIARTVYDAGREVWKVISKTGSVSPELSEVLREKESRRYEGQAMMIDWLKEHNALKPDLDVTTARDILFALTSRDLYLTLTEERGWPSDKYQQWLGDMLVAGLIA